MSKYQRGYISDGAVILLIVAAMLGVITGIVVLGYMASSTTCHRRAAMMRLQSEYGFFQGCMVNVGDRWAPMGYIRIVDGKVQTSGDGDE